MKVTRCKSCCTNINFFSQKIRETFLRGTQRLLSVKYLFGEVKIA